MNFSLIVKPEAELDILKSAQWYEKKQQDLGLRFLDEVEEQQNSDTPVRRYTVSIRKRIVPPLTFTLQIGIEKEPYFQIVSFLTY
jgi:hypothetical protein